VRADLREAPVRACFRGTVKKLSGRKAARNISKAADSCINTIDRLAILM
jgi:hypothetical protein